MWGNGGRFYWGRAEGAGTREVKGIVVVFAWLWSEEKHLRPYIDLYWSLGWRCLICHTEFLTLFFPEKATSLACGVLDELAKELKIRPSPIVLATFSAGSKGCMYKFLQLLDGRCGGFNLDEYRLVRDSICGQIFDSSPVDFTSDVGTQLFLHPAVPLMSQQPKITSWMGKAFASGLDTLFLNRLEAQRAEYWQILYSSIGIGPFLIFCSEDDDLAPYQIVSSFTQHLLDNGGDVKLVNWRNSPHLGHYKVHPAEYQTAVAELLAKALITSCHRSQLHSKTTSISGPCYKISQSVCNLHEAAASSNESLKRVANGPSDHFFLPSSMESNERKEAGPSLNKQQGEIFDRPSINPQGVLSQILFDVCIPKRIEDWDIKPGMALKGRQTFVTSRRNSSLNPIRYLRRSRL
ncbi:uncharacterized protein LOC109711948 [Ananas comosus]|uniref:Uncharacterized protein LOC109711948 n=1 Tax=Ananas comosus TaxID=4615 RepID=A0A6P5FBT4_ANACO|nr:uncharacterized protein LOC109711948 [Ananas comosus]